MPKPHLVVVPHTHWDREWYRTHEAFRVRLVALVDQVLDTLERDPAFRHFMLDGQTIVLDDYLAVRPDAGGRIEKLVREGRLLVGPWHVLPDEWLVSGEALIRNLRFGLAQAGRFGGAMRLGYVPDQFGHVGQLPQIFRRFGFEGAALWRGVGVDVDQTGFWWEAADGTRVFTLYLAGGYGNASVLPLERDALTKRIARALTELAPFVRGQTYCLMNGSDHQPPQPGLPAALAAARTTVASAPESPTYEFGTLPGVLARVRAEQGDGAPVHRGELRSGLRAPLLPGCASARLSQKQREFANDRLLTRVLEPLAAWTGLLGHTVDRELLRFTWGVALENHPHDSICGCSVDGVHAQMETRFDRVQELAHAQLEGVVETLSQHLARPVARRGDGDAFLVWHSNGPGPARVEAVLELDLPGLDPATVRPGAAVRAHVRDAGGRQIPARVDVETPGSVWRTPFSLPLARAMLADLPREMMGFHANHAAWSRVGETLHLRIVVGSEPRGGFDLASERRALAEALAAPGIAALTLEVSRPARLRVSFCDSLPGHGLRVYRLARGAVKGAQALLAGKLPAGGAFLENETFRVEADVSGRVSIRNLEDGRVIHDALRVLSEGDRGDTYNFDPAPEGAAHGAAPAATRVRVHVERASAAEAVLSISSSMQVPIALAASRDHRSEKRVPLPVTLRIRLSAGLARVDVGVSGVNTAEDHRLRLHVRAPFCARHFAVESAFETVERPIDPAADAFGSASPAEFPIGACPQRSFATLDDGVNAVTVAAEGSPEVEAVPEAEGDTSLAVTLLRAVGWLSGGDLRTRPAPAGPMFPTPGAQVPGPFHAALSLQFHAAGAPTRLATAHRFAYPPACLAIGEGAGTGLVDGMRIVEIDDPAIVVSAIEPGVGGTLRVRLYEANGGACTLRGRVPHARSIRAVDLQGEPDVGLPLRVSADRFEAALRPGQLVDLEIDFA